jgi:hypothetical protein
MTDNKFICYLDILGFKSRIDEGKFKEGYEWIIKEIVEPFDYPDKVYLLSDSIIIISNDIKDIVNNSFSIYSQALHKGIFIRGGLTKGKINTPQELRESGNKLVIPYLGKAYLKAYNLEQSINTAAIRVDEDILDEINDIKKFLIKFTEIFPKSESNKEKTFLVTDMGNYSVPVSIFTLISEEISNISRHDHDIQKFINTFVLYYRALRHYEREYNVAFNQEEINKKWLNILESLMNLSPS